uniref:Ig-like domain-containing protein n=1 Tax=Denticeps clupeoides TaxID=299321 RepID=A0AAY4CH68_9TELE
MKIKSAASPSVIFTAALITLIIQGGVGQTWGVEYRPTSICALEGTSAVMSCNYTYPSGPEVKEAFWTEHQDGQKDYIDLSKNPNYKDRVHADCEYKKSRCSLNITRLNKSDAHEYNCRIITDKDVERWTGRPGIMLSVTDLQVELVGAATEGNDVRLVCKTSCNLSSSPTYSWKKNGEPLEKEHTKNNELQLHPVSREDGGRYSCAVKGHEDLSSAEVELDVRYSPKNPTVLGAPPAEIPEGGSVTLSCSSDANPPVQNYTWFKENVTSPVAAGQNFTITNFTSAQVGLYSCQARNEVGVQKSTAVLLTFKGTSSDGIGSGFFLDEGGSVTLSCSSDANPPVQNYTWFKENVTSPVAAGQNFTITNFTSAQVGLYSCQARNEVGVQNSAAVSLLPRGRASELVSSAPSGTRRIVTVTLAVTAVLVVLTAVHHDNIYETLYSTNI